MSFYPVKLFFKHLPHLIMLPLALIINLLSWVWLLWQISPQSGPIFLHYNILFGVDFIGEWWKALYLPITGLLILLANSFLAWVLFSKEKFASELLIFIALLSQIFLFISATLLVFLNV